MGRATLPKTHRTASISVRLNDQVAAEMRDLCAREDGTTSVVLRRVIRAASPHLRICRLRVALLRGEVTAVFGRGLGDIETSRPEYYDEHDFPLIMFIEDWAAFLRCSDRTVERMRRAKQLPEPLPVAGRPRWARASAIEYREGGARRGRRG